MWTVRAYKSGIMLLSVTCYTEDNIDTIRKYLNDNYTGVLLVIEGVGNENN